MTLHLGLDLGGTTIKTALLESSADGFVVISKTSVATGAAGGPETVAENIIAAGKQATGQRVVETVALGVPGHFDRDSGRIQLFPNLPGDWQGFPLRDRVAEGLGLETWMINDARSFTLAEGLLGAGKGRSTVVCITLGTGVGGGLMIDGKLHRGAFGVAGEIGHQIVLPDGPLCGCGNRGCVEALVRSDVLASNAGRPTVADVFQGVRDGDNRCIAAVNQMTGFLGIGLANVVTVLGPDVIVIGGGIAEAGDLVMDPIADAVRSRVTMVPVERIEIVPARFGQYAGAVGAGLAGVEKV